MDIFEAPENGVAVRMYRQGHGDCYLLAMPNKEQGGEPVHVLIDCGYKPGSQNFINPPTDTGDILEHIQASTGKKLDLVIITHEHQDHVNLFNKRNADTNQLFFEEYDEIRNAWFAWTESPTDRLARKLRKKHGDELLKLVESRNQLAAFAAAGEEDPTVQQLDALLTTELGGEEDGFDAAAFRKTAMALSASGGNDFSVSSNKKGMKVIKDQAGTANTRFLSPGQSLMVPGTEVRAYILGPPRRESLLTDEDPEGDESFPGHSSDSHGMSFGAAVREDMSESSPFPVEYAVKKKTALTKKHLKGYFLEHYGKEGQGIHYEKHDEVPANAEWRRIDGEWLYAAGSLALKLNRGINNTSLVVAFELPESRRVLLFVGDAQRGNWISWNKEPCKVDGKEVTARELLGRTVLYKVGHHGSHNATLKGDAEAEHPNLSWMGSDQYGDEFVAMINAVNKWAMEKNNPPWRHPLKSIEEALLAKAQGRVFQTDRNSLKKPGDVSEATWSDFEGRSDFKELYFDYTVEDTV